MISLCILFATEGFYAKTIRNVLDSKWWLPFITFILSLLSSAFGMSKFFLTGPIPFLSKASPLNGLLSVRFLSLFLLNMMFGLRTICIESSFFSYYSMQEYSRRLKLINSTEIEPILAPQYRLLAYFTPPLLSLIVNAVRLVYTSENLGAYLLKYPQFLVSPCFTPFLFEGTKNETTSSLYPIRIWKIGTIFNAFFIGVLPQFILLFMEYNRGVPNWEFLEIVDPYPLKKEYNDALFKGKNGNTIFAISTGSFYFFLILLFFCNYNAFTKLLLNCVQFCNSIDYHCINYEVSGVTDQESIQNPNTINEMKCDGETSYGKNDETKSYQDKKRADIIKSLEAKQKPISFDRKN